MSTQTRTWQRKVLEAARHDAYVDLYWYIEISWQAGQRNAPAAYPGSWIPVIPVAPNPEASRRIAGMLAHLFALSNTEVVATYEPALTGIQSLEQTGCRWYLWDMDVEQDAICAQCGAVERIGHTKVEGVTWLCAECGGQYVSGDDHSIGEIDQ